LSVYLIVGLAWLALAVLGWSCLASAARADRRRVERSAHPRTRRTPTHS
jgi:hypothetical protein